MAYITGLTRDKKEWTPAVHQVDRRRDLHRLWPLLQGLRHDVLAFEEVDEDDSAKMFMKVDESRQLHRLPGVRQDLFEEVVHLRAGGSVKSAKGE